MAKLVTVDSVPAARLHEVLEALRAGQVARRVRVWEAMEIDVETRAQRPVAQVQFSVAGPSLNACVKALSAVHAGGFKVADVCVGLGPAAEVLPSVSWTAAPRSRGWSLRHWFPSLRERRSTLEIHTGIVGSSYFSCDHFILILLGGSMACFGLLTDSVPCILASFFYSPLMSQLLVAVWGLVIADWKLLVKGLKVSVIAASLTWLTGVVVGVLVSLPSVGFESLFPLASSQIDSRGPPAVKNLVNNAGIACIAGVGSALGQSSGIADALAAVAFSVALFPPLVCSGLMTSLSLACPEQRTAKGNAFSDIAVVSFSIYAVSVPCTMLFCYATFKLKRIGGHSIRNMTQAGSPPSTPHLDVEGPRSPLLDWKLQG